MGTPYVGSYYVLSSTERTGTPSFHRAPTSRGYAHDGQGYLDRLIYLVSVYYVRIPGRPSAAFLPYAPSNTTMEPRKAALAAIHWVKRFCSVHGGLCLCSCLSPARAGRGEGAGLLSATIKRCRDGGPPYPVCGLRCVLEIPDCLNSHLPRPGHGKHGYERCLVTGM